MISTFKIKTTEGTHGILRSEIMLKSGGFIKELVAMYLFAKHLWI